MSAGSASRSCRGGPDRRLELVGGALGDDPTAVDHGDPVGQLVGLVEVLGGQHDGRAGRDQVADRVPHLAAGARVEAGRRLVEEDQRRLGDQADAARSSRRRMPPENFLQRLGGGLGQCEPLEQLGGLAPGLGAGQAEQPTEDHEVLGGRQALVDRRVLAGHADQLADDLRLDRRSDAPSLDRSP